MLIKDLMHQGAITCHSQDSLEQIGSLMWNEDCGAIPVLDENDRAIGMITDRDIAMAAVLKHSPLWEITAGELVAGKQLFSCSPEDDVHTVLKNMGTHRVRRMPVLDGEQHIHGIVATKDLVEHIQAQAGRTRGEEISADEAITILQEICKPNALRVAA